MKPPATTKPLSSEELEHDAQVAGRSPDEPYHGSTDDPHLPASESEMLDGEADAKPALEQSLTKLPPG